MSKLNGTLRAGLLVAAGLAGGALVTTFISGPAVAEDQPRMRAALNSLQAAQGELRAATADKGGHRARAIGLVEQAIAEIRAGIAYDNRR